MAGLPKAAKVKLRIDPESLLPDGSKHIIIPPGMIGQISCWDYCNDVSLPEPTPKLKHGRRLRAASTQTALLFSANSW